MGQEGPGVDEELAEGWLGLEEEVDGEGSRLLVGNARLRQRAIRPATPRASRVREAGSGTWAMELKL